MNSTHSIARTSRWLFIVFIFFGTGCESLIERGQSPDALTLPFPLKKKKETTKSDITRYIGDDCGVFGLSYAKIEGVGIAVDLKKTGSNPKPGGQRDYLKRELESASTDLDIESLLASPDTELILLKGMLPPGARKGDLFDIEVGTMGTTEATSLDGGLVLETDLKPIEQLGKTVKQGHVEGIAKGRILVDSIFESRRDRPNQLHGHILGGGVVLKDRNLGLAVRKEFAESDSFSPKTTTMISRAINARFTHVDKSGRHGVAEPKTDRMVELVVPPSHRHNIGRYLQVIINIAHSETASQRLVRMDKLSTDMLDPNLAAETSLRLEALGNDGIPILKRALGHDNLEVKFQAAQALAYMGETDGVDYLKFVAKTEPAFRWHALTALTALNDTEAGAALTELMQVDSAETRYGAFRAMRTRSPDDPLVAGVKLRDFYLHRIPSATTQPMLHFARHKRPEIVVFGDEQTVSDQFLYVQSGITIRSTGEGRVSITRYTADEKQQKTCSNRISDLTETLSHIGFGYSDLLKMVRSAKSAGTLNTRLAINAVPRLGRSYIPGEVVSESSSDSSTDSSTEEIDFEGADAMGEPQATTDTPKKSSSDPALQKTSTWSKMMGWFE